MAPHYSFLLAAVVMLMTPVTTPAMEQSFAQQDIKATVRITPDSPSAGSKVTMALKLEKEGLPVTDRKVVLRLYEKGTGKEVLHRDVDILEDEYLESWTFDSPGDYKIAVTIAGGADAAPALGYELDATVGETKGGHEGHGFFSHHFGEGKWRWWSAGMMLLMMVPMMIIAL